MPSPSNTFHKWFARAASVMVVLAAFAMIAQDAEARRLGGGKSFGRQSPNVTRQQAAPQQPAQQQQAQGAGSSQPQPAAPQPAGNRWMGALGGLAAGLGISALLSHFGLMGPLASALGNVLMIGLLVLAAVLLWRLFTSRAGAGTNRERNLVLDGQGSPFYRSSTQNPAAQATGTSASTNVYGAPLAGMPQQSPAALAWSVPADFDTEGFLRSAKVYFRRLQAAWDARDFGDIRKFTTPETFAEIKMQSEEAPGKSDRTEIDNLDATLLGIETAPSEYVASVRFTGTIRQDGGYPEAFEEVWTLAKPVDGRSGWLLAGIQQATQ